MCNSLHLHSSSSPFRRSAGVEKKKGTSSLEQPQKIYSSSSACHSTPVPTNNRTRLVYNIFFSPNNGGVLYTSKSVPGVCIAPLETGGTAGSE